MTHTLFAALLAAAVGAGQGEDHYPDDWADCTVVHIRADGTRTTRPPLRSPSAGGQAGASAYAGSKGHGASSAASTVTASSSTKGGKAVASSSSTADGAGRSVSQRRDQNGCVVTIDER